MRYWGYDEPLLPWLLAQAREAEHLLMSGPITSDGVACLEVELHGLLARGGSLVVRGGDDLPVLRAMSDDHPGQVLLPRGPSNDGLRIAVRRRDGQAVAYVGSGAISRVGLNGGAEGVVLDGRRDASVALRLMQAMTTPDDEAVTPAPLAGDAPRLAAPTTTRKPPVTRTMVLVEIDTLVEDQPEVRVFLNGGQVVTTGDEPDPPPR